MASKTLTFEVGQFSDRISTKILDGAGNDITAQCSVVYNLSDPTLFSIFSNSRTVAIKAGTCTRSLTFTASGASITINAAGDLNGTDTMVVVPATPKSGSFGDSAPSF